jgi:hypothetical protein
MRKFFILLLCCIAIIGCKKKEPEKLSCNSAKLIVCSYSDSITKVIDHDITYGFNNDGSKLECIGTVTKYDKDKVTTEQFVEEAKKICASSKKLFSSKCIYNKTEQYISELTMMSEQPPGLFEPYRSKTYDELKATAKDNCK